MLLKENVWKELFKMIFFILFCFGMLVMMLWVRQLRHPELAVKWTPTQEVSHEQK